MAFRMMGESLQKQLTALQSLQGNRGFQEEAIAVFEEGLQECFEIGYVLDEAIQNGQKTEKKRAKYLGALRKMQKQAKRWNRKYAEALRSSIRAKDQQRFERLVEASLTPLKQPSIKKAALGYYESIRQHYSIAIMETLRDEARLEEKSVAFLSTEAQAFKRDIEVSAKEHADRPVTVSSRKKGDNVFFSAKNNNDYPMTMTLSFTKFDNFRASAPLPLVMVLEARSSREILRITRSDKSRSAVYSARYGWVMGSIHAVHSDPLYRIPLEVGTRAFVSQGVDGGVTHKGLTRYAVDFACPVGTKIYAARGGTVVATESRYNKGGFSEEYGKYANFIIIEHDDHTLGKYFHLKQHGVMVRVGARINMGQMIGYSGNTGYSSGPHLHFSVSGVDSTSKHLPVTLPMRFKSASGIVKTTKTRDIYRVVRVR